MPRLRIEENGGFCWLTSWVMMDRHQLETPTNRSEEVGRNGQSGLEILKDERLVFQLLPLGHRERRRRMGSRPHRRRNAHFSVVVVLLLAATSASRFMHKTISDFNHRERQIRRRNGYR